MSWIPISISTLKPELSLSFDVYLHISGKYLLYVRRGDKFEKSRVEKLQHKNMQFVHIQEKDRAAYDAYLKGRAANALSDPKLSVEAKAAILTSQSKAAVEEIFAEPERKENYLNTESAAVNQVEILKRYPEAFEQMLNVAKFDKTTYQHSVNVATIAIGIAQQCGLSEELCQKIGTGALLHDLGRSPSGENPDLIGPAKPIEQMTKPEREAYFQHPRAGAGSLLGKKYISPEVLDIILLHEERLDGKGFPSGVKKLDRLFQIVGLANLYDRMVTFENIAPRDAYERISQMDPLPYEEDLVLTLKEVLVANKIY